MMISLQESIEREYQDRINYDPKKAPMYGVTCLDHALRFILPNELVIIGADTGVGKSELALHIAKHNAKRGLNVYLFYLEGGEMEAVRRFKWGDFLAAYYSKYKAHIEYADWVTNQIPLDIIVDVELNILPKMYQELYGDRLSIYPMHDKFNVEDVYLSLSHDLKEGVEDKKKMFGANLIVIDHLHYFNMEDDNGPEAQKLTNILRRCKDIADFHHIPVIVVSHLRKKTKDRGFPDNEDFHGSSNIPKISSTSIIISPSYRKESNATLIYPTYFRITKSRVGIKSDYVIMNDYDLRQRIYLEQYDIYPINDKGHPSSTPFEKHNMPQWARRHLNDS